VSRGISSPCRAPKPGVKRPSTPENEVVVSPQTSSGHNEAFPQTTTKNCPPDPLPQPPILATNVRSFANHLSIAHTPEADSHSQLQSPGSGFQRNRQGAPPPLMDFTTGGGTPRPDRSAAACSRPLDPRQPCASCGRTPPRSWLLRTSPTRTRRSCLRRWGWRREMPSGRIHLHPLKRHRSDGARGSGSWEWVTKAAHNYL